MAERNPWQVLGVSPTASDEEITKAYRSLAKKYHPDLHPGDEECARKMAEVNSAYDLIKSGKASSAQSGYSQSGYSQTGYSQTGYSYGYSYGDEYSYTNDTERMNAALRYIQLHAYSQAIAVLNTVTTRGGRWHYYMAICSVGLGNTVYALEHARVACELEPENEKYRELYDRLTARGNTYAQTEQTYTMPRLRFRSPCFWLCLANCLCGFISRLFGGQGGYSFFCC